jgi:hypothetical protein
MALGDEAVLNLGIQTVFQIIPDTKPKLREFFSSLFQSTLSPIPADRHPMEKICKKLGGKGDLW